MPTTVSVSSPINSLSYADFAGLAAGLERLPGETTRAFVDRIQRAAHSRRDVSYEGLLNEINLQLGLEPQVAITIDSGLPSVLVSVTASQLHVSSPEQSWSFPLVTMDADNFWRWRRLSDLVTDLNATGFLLATLASDDAPAFQLAKQSNEGQVVNERVGAVSHQFDKAVPLADSLLFNQSVPSWTLTGNTLRFTTAPAAGTTVSYRYRSPLPFSLVATPASLLSLSDAVVMAAALTPDGDLVHQVKEALQSTMLLDRSYWAD